MNPLLNHFTDGKELIPPRIMDADEALFKMMQQLDSAPNNKFEYLPKSSVPDIKMLPITHVKDQGSIGSCTGFAATACLESLYDIHANLELDLSEQFAYSLNKLNDPWRGVYYSGSSTVTASRVLRDYGVCHENYCPYVKKEFVEPTNLMMEDARRRRAVEIHYLDIVSKDDYKQAIAQQMPILIGFKMFQGFSNNKVIDGKIKILGTIRTGGHAVMIYGYDNDGVYIKNSWGTDYSLGGTVHMPWDILFSVVKTATAIEGLRPPYDIPIPSLPKPPPKKLINKRKSLWYYIKKLFGR